MTWPISGKPAGWKRSCSPSGSKRALMIRQAGPSGARSASRFVMGLGDVLMDVAYFWLVLEGASQRLARRASRGEEIGRARAAATLWASILPGTGGTITGSP